MKKSIYDIECNMCRKATVKRDESLMFILCSHVVCKSCRSMYRRITSQIPGVNGISCPLCKDEENLITQRKETVKTFSVRIKEGSYQSVERIEDIHGLNEVLKEKLFGLFQKSIDIGEEHKENHLRVAMEIEAQAERDNSNNGGGGEAYLMSESKGMDEELIPWNARGDVENSFLTKSVNRKRMCEGSYVRIYKTAGDYSRNSKKRMLYDEYASQGRETIVDSNKMDWERQNDPVSWDPITHERGENPYLLSTETEEINEEDSKTKYEKSEEYNRINNIATGFMSEIEMEGIRNLARAGMAPRRRRGGSPVPEAPIYAGNKMVYSSMKKKK